MADLEDKAGLIEMGRRGVRTRQFLKKKISSINRYECVYQSGHFSASNQTVGQWCVSMIGDLRSAKSAEQSTMMAWHHGQDRNPLISSVCMY